MLADGACSIIPVACSSMKKVMILNKSHTLGSNTASVHAGEPRTRPSQSVNEPIVTGVMFPFGNTQEMVDFVEERKYSGSASRPDYGRHSNPTRKAAETKLAAMEAGSQENEGSLDAILTSSGMSALSGLLLYLLSAGDHVIVSDTIYRVTKMFATDVLVRYGVEVTFVNPCNIQNIKTSLKENTKAILVETPSNPLNFCIELRELAALGRQREVATIVDSTLATPFNCRPLTFGIDYVVHSVTKYLSGHNDVMAGAIIGEEWAMAGLRSVQTQLGAICDPHSSAYILRGLKTFGLRMAQHNANALALAQMLSDQEEVEKVWYAGLDSHPDHEIAKSQMDGFGGVVSVEMADHENAALLNDGLKMAYIGASLGATETMVHQPWLLSHYDQTRQEREALGIREGLIRIACGIEDTVDLLQDFKLALASL